MATLRAGKLRHRVEIQTRTTTQNDYGESTHDWATVATVWASVEPLSGRELLRADQVEAETSHRIIMRHRELTSQQRIVFDNRTFEIESVICPDEVSHMLEVLAREVA